MTEHRTFDLAYWINERQAIKIRRERGIRPPFSPDPNMANVRYCNVHREDDKVTKWIAENWRNPHFDDPNLTLAMVMARMVNWPDTLAKLPFPDGTMSDLGDSKHIMKAIAGKKWTAAYTISTCGRKMEKEDYVFDVVLQQVADKQWDWSNTTLLSQAHSKLSHVVGLGSFLSAQVIADLKNTPNHPLSRAHDFWTWSAPGPGSLRGLVAYYGKPVGVSQYARAIRECYTEVVPLVQEYVGKIHMQDFQNCLCEFSKYMRVKEGDGRVRNKYSAG